MPALFYYGNNFLASRPGPAQLPCINSLFMCTPLAKLSKWTEHSLSLSNYMGHHIVTICIDILIQ